MLRASFAAALIALVLRAPADAQVELRGSDTMYEFMQLMMSPQYCDIDPALLTFVGGGSAVGENRMTAGLQQVAPFGRASTSPIAAVSQGCLEL